MRKKSAPSVSTYFTASHVVTRRINLSSPDVAAAVAVGGGGGGSRVGGRGGGGGGVGGGGVGGGAAAAPSETVRDPGRCGRRPARRAAHDSETLPARQRIQGLGGLTPPPPGPRAPPSPPRLSK